MEHTIKQLTQELADARKQAEQESRSKSNFLAVASHDLRQPLHALSLYLEVLEDELTNDAQALIMRKARQSHRALSMLIHSLLDMARLESGVVQVKVEHISLTSLMHELNEEWLLQAHECGLTLRMRDCKNLIVSSDAMLLKRILRNFLANAVHHTRRGGILFGCRRVGDKVRIAVWDTGVGISKKEMSSIFHAFYQGSQTEEEQEKGLGLGLAIVQGLANILKYRIHVRSQLGIGSCFGVDVPFVKMDDTIAPLPVLAPSEHDFPTKFEGNLIVVIDDDSMVQNAMCELLTHWGCWVCAGDSADAVFAQLQTQGFPIPSVIVADYMLGDSGIGPEEVKRIRSKYASALIPCIIVTAVTEEKTLRDIKSEFHFLLKKPVNAGQLRASLSYCIS